MNNEQVMPVNETQPGGGLKRFLAVYQVPLLTLAVFICGAVLLGAFHKNMMPGPDLSGQLQAASHLGAGHGYSITAPLSANCLVQGPEFRRQVLWPPFLSYAVALGLRFGLSHSLALLAVTLPFLALGSWGWVRLAGRVVGRGWLLFLFAAIVAINCVPTRHTWTHSDIMLWSLAPLWTLAWMKCLDRGEQQYLWPALLAGLLGVVAAGFRYQAVSWIAAAGLLALLRTNWQERVKAGLAGALPPAVVLGGIWGANKVWGTSPFSSNIASRRLWYEFWNWNWYRVQPILSLEQFFTKPTGLIWVRQRLTAGLHPGVDLWEHPLKLLFAVITILGTVAVCCAFARAKKKNLSLVAGAGYLTTFGMLTFLAVSSTGSAPLITARHHPWYRYYAWFTPIAALGCVLLVRQLRKELPRAVWWAGVGGVTLLLIASGVSWFNLTMGQWRSAFNREEERRSLHVLQRLDEASKRLCVITPQSRRIKWTGIETYRLPSDEVCRQLSEQRRRMYERAEAGELTLLVVDKKDGGQPNPEVSVSRVVQELELVPHGRLPDGRLLYGFPATRVKVMSVAGISPE